MTNPIAQAARIIGGRLQIEHSYLCHIHRGGQCGCDPRYTLRRSPRRRAKR